MTHKMGFDLLYMLGEGGEDLRQPCPYAAQNLVLYSLLWACPL
jgi:hypothetical protein